MQAQPATRAARHLAMTEGPAEHDTSIPFLKNQDGTFKPVGPLEDIQPVVLEEDRQGWNPDENKWETL